MHVKWGYKQANHTFSYPASMFEYPPVWLLTLLPNFHYTTARTQKYIQESTQGVGMGLADEKGHTKYHFSLLSGPLSSLSLDL